MSATSGGGGGSVSEGSDAGESSQSTMSVGDSPSTSFHASQSDNITKINLSEEMSSGVHIDMAGSKMNLTFDEKQQQNDGVVNMAFDYEEGGGGTRGDAEFKTVNGGSGEKEKVEAVNLELVNMVPYSNGNGTSYGVPLNGIPVKKDSEAVDMSSPYDEYFVPVNEHKKYMRGEKLYVTKDKRRPASWRRCLSWIIACSVISVVLIVAILAGTGVILSQDPNSVQEASIGRKFGGEASNTIGTDGFGTLNDSWPSSALNETHRYVPRSIESELIIDNLDFDPALSDRNSSTYKQFSSMMEDHLRMILLDSDTVKYGASQIGLNVVNISQNPFKVFYRIGWNHKQGSGDLAGEPVEMENVKAKLVETLAKNQGYIDKYHIDMENIKVGQVLNICQMNNGGCSHICYYNYLNQQFTCTCPTNLVLDSSRKKCVEWVEPSELDYAPVPDHTNYPGQYESSDHEYDGNYHSSDGTKSHGSQEGGSHDHGSHEHGSFDHGSHEDGSYEHGLHEHDSQGNTAYENESHGHGSHEGGSHDHGSHGHDSQGNTAYEHEFHGHGSHEGGSHDHGSHGHDSQGNTAYEHESHGHGSHEGGPHDHGSHGHDSQGNTAYENESHGHGSHEGGSRGNTAYEHESRGHGSHDSDHPLEHKFVFAHDRESSSEPSSDGKGISDVPGHQGSGYVVGSDGSKLEDTEGTPEPTSVHDDHEGNTMSVLNVGGQPQKTSGMDDNQDISYTGSYNNNGDSESTSGDSNGQTGEVISFSYDGSNGDAKPEPTSGDEGHTGPHSVGGSVDHNHMSHDGEAKPEPTSEPSSDHEGHTGVSSAVGGSNHDHMSKDGESNLEPTPEPSSDHGHITHEGNATPEHTPEPSSDHEGHTGVYSAVGNSNHDHITHDGEAKSEPTPEPTSDREGHISAHNVFGSSDHDQIHRNGEATLEPTPEPSSDHKEHISGEHVGSSDRDQMSQDGETKPEPTPEPSSDHDHMSHDGEAKPEPTPEPSSDHEGHTDVSSSVGGSNHDHMSQDGVVKSEPTPEPSPDHEGHISAENVGSSDHDHMSHDGERKSEPTPEPSSDHKGQTDVSSSVGGSNHDHMSQDGVVKSESTSEPTSNIEGHTGLYDLNGNLDHESMPHGEEKKSDSTINSEQLNSGDTIKDTLEHSERSNQDASSKLDSISNLGHDEFDPQSKGENPYSVTEVLVHEHHPESSDELINSHRKPGELAPESEERPSMNPDSSPNSVPHLEEVLNKDSMVHSTENSLMENHKPEGEVYKSENREHHVPFLEDILVKESVPDSAEHNSSTTHGENVLKNVEKTSDGKPIIEDILIQKLSPKETEDEVNAPKTYTVDQNSNSSNNNEGQNPTEDENSHSSSAENATEKNYNELTKIKQITGETDYPATEASDKSSTDHPSKISIDQISQMPSFKDKESEISEITTSFPAIIEYKNIDDENVKNKNFGNDNEGPADDNNDQIKSNSVHTTENPDLGVSNTKNKNDLKETQSVTESSKTSQVTKNPQYDFESHTIPVNIVSDFSKEDEFSGKKQQTTSEKQANVSESQTGVPETAGEEVTTIQYNPNSETYNPESADFIKTHKSEDEKGNTKELSNNIKEGAEENDEFNTLFDKDYKNKNDYSVKDGNNNKYLNKQTYLKGDKKKFKDFTKGDKTDPDRKIEDSTRPAVTPEDIILQKHVNGNGFDFDYHLHPDETTKMNDGSTHTDFQETGGAPGIALKPHVIGDHEITVLQTVSPGYETQTLSPNENGETDSATDSKVKLVDVKEDSKTEKDYSKFDKDYKYEKQKGGKKKDLKKKVGSKDGKNVELDDGRKSDSDVDDQSDETGKDDSTFRGSQESISDFPETTTTSLYKVTTNSVNQNEDGGFKVGYTTGSKKLTEEPKNDLTENVLSSEKVTVSPGEIGRKENNERVADTVKDFGVKNDDSGQVQTTVQPLDRSSYDVDFKNKGSSTSDLSLNIPGSTSNPFDESVSNGEVIATLKPATNTDKEKIKKTSDDDGRLSIVSTIQVPNEQDVISEGKFPQSEIVAFSSTTGTTVEGELQSQSIETGHATPDGSTTENSFGSVIRTGDFPKDTQSKSASPTLPEGVSATNNQNLPGITINPESSYSVDGNLSEPLETTRTTDSSLVNGIKSETDVTVSGDNGFPSNKPLTNSVVQSIPGVVSKTTVPSISENPGEVQEANYIGVRPGGILGPINPSSTTVGSGSVKTEIGGAPEESFVAVPGGSGFVYHKNEAGQTENSAPGGTFDGQYFQYQTNGVPGSTSSKGVVEKVTGTLPSGQFVLHNQTGFSPEATATGSSTNGPTTFIYREFLSGNGTHPGGFFTRNTSFGHPEMIFNGQGGFFQNGQFINSSQFTFADGSNFGPNGSFFYVFNQTTGSGGSTGQPTFIVGGQNVSYENGQPGFNSTIFHTFFPGNYSNNPNFFKFFNKSFPGNFSNNSTFYQFINKPFPGNFSGNSTVYKLINRGPIGTTFSGNFNAHPGHFQTFTNASGTFVFSNGTTQPSFVIRGQSGDFGNTTIYFLGNNSITNRTVFSSLPQKPFNFFKNSTVYKIGNATGNSPSTLEILEVTGQPQNSGSNHSFRFTHQLTPTSLSSGTAYKVNDYFGYVSKCAAGQFQCINGTSKRGSACINLSSKCDSINDCSDGSDETGCIENGCPGNFQCSDGTCLKRHLVCNGIVECSDGSDEKQCENWKCEFDEFQCPSKRCIPVLWQCDGKPDCDNHTDEQNCQRSCGNDEFLCPEGWCIPMTYKCNGVLDCGNGEDEQLCHCSPEEFKCQSGGCISKTLVCNGVDECPDRSDEWECLKIDPNSSLLWIRTPVGEYEPVCADNWSASHSNEVCASLGYSSAIPMENDGASVTIEKSFYVLKKQNTTDELNRNFLINLEKLNGTCSSGKLVEVSCQEFSCGSRSMTDSGNEGRLVGGVGATSGQWPSVALLYNVRNLHTCTANVITPRWVLASYNCMKMGSKAVNLQDWKLFSGSTDFEAEKENTETRKIITLVPHPQVKFNQFLFSNDLALAELDQPLQFSNNVGAVCLPEQEIQPRQICVTAGWGINSPEDKNIKQQLQYLPVPTMSLAECNSTDHYAGFITQDKICAGYNPAEKSLCYNEEGAPLMCVNDRGEWELQGVLSYHSNCGRGSHPSIFSSITPVRDWIKQTIGNSFERKIIPATKR